MIALLQRVTKASVRINGELHSSIGPGIVIFLGVAKEDAVVDAAKLADKITGLRVIADETDKMNISVKDAGRELLVISQFTLCANLKGGRRPDFFPAMEPTRAKQLYEQFIARLRTKGVRVAEGTFAARMEVGLVNDGPVTFILDSNSI